MAVRIIGEDPFARGGPSHLKPRIATLFLSDHTLVTLPGIHATQRLAYVDALNQERLQAGQPPLSELEGEALWRDAVDLILDNGFVLIRPDPSGLATALAADEVLQELVSIRRIRFLNVHDAGVFQTLRARGELWRIAPLPQSVKEMQEMIAKARMRIAHQPVYYYNMVSGTRFLTCQQFAGLAHLEPPELAAQLQEIRDYSARANPRGRPEVDFFMAEGRFGAAELAGVDFPTLAPEAVQAEHARLSAAFLEAVKPEMRQDNPDDPLWRKAMLSALVQQNDSSVTEEVLHGLSPEFFLQIRWLPGGRVENGELIFDPLFDELEAHPDDAELRALCDQNAKIFFFNSMREYGDIEYANIGRIVSSLSSRPQADGRRDVYISEVKLQGVAEPVVRIIRLLKWGIREHLEEGKGLLESIMESEEYVEFILDRRLGCRQLGMKLPSRISIHKLGERYHGSRPEFENQVLWATYIERDYTRGMATDKVPPSRFRNGEFALRFARLLGQAAAPNLIVGRLHLDNRVMFDSGDEVLELDSAGLPESIIVTDHSGTFADYRHDLIHFASGYADPVNRRIPDLVNAAEFAQAYLAGFRARFAAIKEEFLRRKRAFFTLFRHGRYDQEGAFAYRWERVLERLERSDAGALAEAIANHIHLR